MSNTKHPVSSGFDDIDAVIGHVNKKEELQDSTEKLDRYLEHVNGALYRAEKALEEANKSIARIESATASLEKSASKIQPYLNSIEESGGFKFKAQLSDSSIESIKATHGEFIAEEKKLLAEHREALKNSMSESVSEEKKAFENHKIEMERTKEYGEGVWLSQRAWSWVGGLLIGWGAWFVASVILLIVSHPN